jgi:Tol biopolymer transport system component
MRASMNLLAWWTLMAVASADDTRLATTVDGSTALSGSVRGLSKDGRCVLFSSASPEYVVGDGNAAADLFVLDLPTGVVERVNVANDGSEDGPSGAYDVDGSISADGRYVAFTARTALDPADDAAIDIYLRDRVNGTTTLVSHSGGHANPGQSSHEPRISSDGSCIVFLSDVDDLVPGDTNNWPDIFAWDRATDTITRVSTSSNGEQFTTTSLWTARVSGNGRVVTFEAVHYRGDVGRYASYVKDLDTGTLDFNPGVGIELSDDGRFILLNSYYSLDPTDTNHDSDGYLFDRELGTLERVTFGTGFRELSKGAHVTGMSVDMRRISYLTADDAAGIGSQGHQDGYVFDRDSGVAHPMTLGPDDERSDSDCTWGGLSADGLRAAFGTVSSGFWPGDDDGDDDVFIRTSSDVLAEWTSYGSGFGGRFGIPALDLSAPPRRGATFDLGIGNSSGLYTSAFLFAGLASTSLPTSLGGTLLVVPIATLPLPLSPYTNEFPMTVPWGSKLPGVHVYLQALELDPWAERGVSFTPGLDLTIGD